MDDKATNYLSLYGKPSLNPFSVNKALSFPLQSISGRYPLVLHEIYIFIISSYGFSDFNNII